MEFDELTAELGRIRCALVNSADADKVEKISLALFEELKRVSNEIDACFGDMIEAALIFLTSYFRYEEDAVIRKEYPECIPNPLIWYAVFRLQEKLDEVPDVPEDEDGKEALNDPE